jgi:hypothetical protein
MSIELAMAKRLEPDANNSDRTEELRVENYAS